MVATGACHTEGVTFTDNPPVGCWHLVKTRKAKDRRLGEIRDGIRDYVIGSDLVLIEMLPPNMKGAGITGMVQGVVRDMLIDLGIPYGDVGPSSLKKYATGKGNASKTDMSLAAMKRGGVEIAEDNQCDAWWLWVMANDYLGQPSFSLPQVQRDMLKNIERKG